MKFSWPPIVIEAVGDIDILLDFSQRDPCANRMNGAGRNEIAVAWRDGLPVDDLLDRTIQRSCAKSFRGHLPLEADTQHGSRFTIENIP